MKQPEQGPEGIHGVPQEVLDRARDDFEWASRLLHVDTRTEALAELEIESEPELDARLDELANSTLREAVTRFGGGQQLQP